MYNAFQFTEGKKSCLSFHQYQRSADFHFCDINVSVLFGFLANSSLSSWCVHHESRKPAAVDFDRCTRLKKTFFFLQH